MVLKQELAVAWFAWTGLFREVLLLNGLGVVGEDADVAGNAQGCLDDLTGRQVGFFSRALAAAWA